MKIFVTLGSPCATSLVRKTSKGCATVDERHPASPPHTKCVTVLKKKINKQRYVQLNQCIACLPL